MKNEAGFTKPTKAEVNKIIKEKKKGVVAKGKVGDFVATEKREKIDAAYELQFNWLQLKLVETELKFKNDQVANKKGEKEIVELYNGAAKPMNMLIAEYNLKLYAYKRLIGEVENAKAKLKEFKVSDEDVKSIQNGVFDFTKLK